MEPPSSLPPVPGEKLRLMCSYGGHIIPRPHDKSLCYVGGETRMVVIDRHSSLSSLVNRLSRSLLDGRPFTLKYQLPSEDLDSLVSVTTDEDLDHLIDECDRISDSSPIRVFLFFGKPETAASLGSLLDDAKSDSWFVDALNGSLLPRTLSDTAAIECLVDGFNQDSESNRAVEGGEMNKQEVLNSGPPDSPVIENGFSSSPPRMSNLPPFQVRVDPDQRVGAMEEQIAPNYGGAALPPLPTAVVHPGNSGGFSDRVLEEERSDPLNYRKKPPLPLQTAQLKLVAGSSRYDLASPDSAKTQNPQIQIQQSQNQNLQYAQSDQKQQQFIHTNTHYIPHPIATTPPMTMTSHYPIYATQTPNNQNQQYPVYGMPIATAAGGVYRRMVTSIQGYVRYAPMQHPSNSISVTSSGNYGFGYAKGTPEQVYYSQAQAAPTGLAPQYQTTTTAARIATPHPI